MDDPSRFPVGHFVAQLILDLSLYLLVERQQTRVLALDKTDQVEAGRDFHQRADIPLAHLEEILLDLRGLAPPPAAAVALPLAGGPGGACILTRRVSRSLPGPGPRA